MNSRQLGILIVLVVLLGGAGIVVHKRQQASWQSSGAQPGVKLLGELPINDIAHVGFHQGTNELNLVKKGDLWRVRERSDYPANFQQISDFLLKARDLKAVQSETVTPSAIDRLQLADPGQGTNAALVVEFKDVSDRTLKTLLVGKPHLRKGGGGMGMMGGEDQGWPDGRYVRLRGSDTVSVISEPLDNIEPRPDAWLNKDFIHVDKAKTVEVKFPASTNSWKVTRESDGADWKLASAKPGEELDAAKTAGISSPLASTTFTDVARGALRATGTNQPTVIHIDTFDNFSYTIAVGQKTNEDYPVMVSVAADLPKERVAGKDEKPDEKARLDKEFRESQQKLQEKLKSEQGLEGWTYLVQSWSLEPILKERSQLMAEKKAEPKKEAGSSG